MAIGNKLSIEELAGTMAELKPPYTSQQALVEAGRCLFCFDAPCIMACPTGIDIPSFIKKISTGNVTGAARTILTANILGASCARVCPTEVLCEGACVVLDREGDPVKIGRLQRYATDPVLEREVSVLNPPKERNGHRVAIIGGGPASLGCAAELAQLGYDVVVFERKPQGGGLNTYGIAYYKMKPEVSLAEVELVRSLGVEFRFGVTVGVDVDPAKLREEFDAIFIGIGLGNSYRLGIPGEDLPGVGDALEFIEEIHSLPLEEVRVGDSVAVIGCGNTAIDAVTQALRLGAKRAAIIYRRTAAEMPAYDFEYELAKNDGADFLFQTLPVEVLKGENGTVAGLKLVRTESDDDGDFRILPGTEFVESFDMVLRAVGQEKQSDWLKRCFPDLEIDRRGVVRTDPATGATSLPGVFCGGDCANGGREVVNAVGEGKKAARGIHAVLCEAKAEGPVQPSRYGVKGNPVNSGLMAPVRAPELEEAYYRGNSDHG